VPRRVRGTCLPLGMSVVLLACEERGMPCVYRRSMTVYARAGLGLTVSTRPRPRGASPAQRPSLR